MWSPGGRQSSPGAVLRHRPSCGCDLCKSLTISKDHDPARSLSPESGSLVGQSRDCGPVHRSHKCRRVTLPCLAQVFVPASSASTWVCACWGSAWSQHGSGCLRGQALNNNYCRERFESETAGRPHGMLVIWQQLTDTRVCESHHYSYRSLRGCGHSVPLRQGQFLPPGSFTPRN